MLDDRQRLTAEPDRVDEVDDVGLEGDEAAQEERTEEVEREAGVRRQRQATGADDRMALELALHSQSRDSELTHHV